MHQMKNFREKVRGRELLLRIFESAFAGAAVLAALLLMTNLKYLTPGNLKPVPEHALDVLKRHFAVFLIGSFLFGAVLDLFLHAFGRKVFSFLEEYRYPLAIILFCLLVTLKLHGSSLGMFRQMLKGDVDVPGVLLGTVRAVRTDEWSVLSPIMLSQYQGAAPFSYFSEIVRGSTTDVFLEYGAPVRDIAVLFRPFHWGFLMLPAEYGYSFWWCGRLLALSLVSYEFGLLITDRDKKISAVYTLMLTLSPVVQWWFAINGLVEMLVYGQLFIILLHQLFTKDKVWIRMLSALGITILGGGYIFTTYPAWQIPLGYCFLVLFLWILKKDREKLKKPAPWLFLAGAALLMGAGVFYILKKSGGTLQLISETEYPGKSEPGRVMPETLSLYYNYGLDTISSLRAEAVICDRAHVFSLAPLGFLLSLVLMIRRKKADFLCLAMDILLAVIFFLLFVPAGFPVSKLLFLGKFSSYRVVQVIGFADLVLLLYTVSQLRKETFTKKEALLLSGGLFLLFAGWISVLTSKGQWTEGISAKWTLLCILIPVFSAGGMLYLSFLSGLSPDSGKRSRRELSMVLLAAAVMFFAGGTVNPVSRGLSNVYELELGQEIQRIAAEDPEGKWAVESGGSAEEGSIFMASFPIMFGAPTITSVNIYPDLERWESIDPEGKYLEVYNRYAHINLMLTAEETEFEPGAARDVFAVRLNTEDFEKIGGKYVLTKREDLDVLLGDGKFEKIYSADGYNIYRR